MNKLKTFFKSLAARTQETFHRYPVSMAVIVLGFALMLMITWQPYDYWYRDDFLGRMSFITWVTLPVFTALTLFFRSRWWLLLGLLFGGVLYFTTQDGLPQGDILHILMWGFAFYSLMFILPHWRHQQNNGFWNYCAQIFFILVLGFVCSGILAASLTLAIESIRSLFEVDIDYRWTDTMLQFAFFFVLPIFVHVGLPQNWEDLEDSKDYPHFFKPVSYYLLTPISLLYFGILGVYVLKILVTWEWPAGQVAYPILFLSMLIYGFYLISYPWRKDWQRWFFVALLPFLAVYFMAMGIRIQEYGLTELRYLGVLLGICLTLMTLYFAFVKRQRLQMMLIPLAVAAFVFAAGPWGASELPIRSQEKRLEALLTEIGALQDGRLVVVDKAAVTDEQQQQISSIVDYLYWCDRLDDLQAWTDLDLSDEEDMYRVQDKTVDFMEEMGLEFTPWGIDYGRDEGYFDYGVKYQATYEISGFDEMAEFDASYDVHFPGAGNPITWSNGEIFTTNMSASGLLTISNGTSELSFDVLTLHRSLEEQGTDPYQLNPSQMMLEGENREMKIRVYLSNISGYFEGEEETVVESLTVWGRILVDFK